MTISKDIYVVSRQVQSKTVRYTWQTNGHSESYGAIILQFLAITSLENGHQDHAAEQDAAEPVGIPQLRLGRQVADNTGAGTGMGGLYVMGSC